MKRRHRCSFDREPARAAMVRVICICGWTSFWSNSSTAAAEESFAHLAGAIQLAAAFERKSA